MCVSKLKNLLSVTKVYSDCISTVENLSSWDFSDLHIEKFLILADILKFKMADRIFHFTANNPP